MVNLLSNAAKYTPEGGRVWLTVHRQARPELADAAQDGQGDGDEALIRVKDSGIGMEAGLLPHIFELFSQGDRPLDRTQSGLGIGLPLVKSLVEMHGGTVTAQSKGIGQGSEFIVKLPAISSAREEPRSQPSRKKRALQRSNGNEEPTTDRLRVLAVDDSGDATTVLSIFLRRYGYEVQTAYDGPAALQAALDFLPDVVVLDIGLPEMNGYEVAQRMRQEPALQNAVLVAITGYGQEADRQLSQEAGFDHHPVKPPDMEALLQLLAAAHRQKGRDVQAGANGVIL